MKDFAAIDFETANYERSSVCSVGLVIVRNSEIVDSYYSLIHPEPNYYNYWCTEVHGLTREDTESAPVFPHHSGSAYDHFLLFGIIPITTSFNINF